MGRHSLPRARHAAPSKPLSRFLPYATIAVALTGVAIALTSPAATQAPTAAAVTVTEDSPGWDCATMGNRVCGSRGQGIWVEYGIDGLDGGHEAEVIYGDPSKRPRTNTADIGETFFYADDQQCGWVALPITVGTAADGFTIDPAGCN